MLDLNESQTRKQLINPMLVAAGWDIVSYNETKGLNNYNNCAITEYPTKYGPADYALCVGGEILGIVEAKKVKSGTQSVLTQAERYSRGLLHCPFNFNGYRVPFLYSTNGKQIQHHDVRHSLSRSREIYGFHTPEALIEKLNYNFEERITKFFGIPDNKRMRPISV